MLCASAAGAARTAVHTGRCSTPSRSRHPRASLLPPSSSFLPPTPHFPTASPFCGSGIQPLTARPPRSSAAAAAEAAEEALDTTPDAVDDTKERPEVVVNAGKWKPRLVLKFIWMEKNIGLGLDHMIPGHGAVPLSPYYFWPRKDAWEELKALLESKPWISQKRTIILLNQATDIINLWQQSGAGSLQQ